jgi:hypothetical protein
MHHAGKIKEFQHQVFHQMLPSSNVVRLVDLEEARAVGMMTVVIMMPGAKSSIQISGGKNRRDKMIAIGMIDMTEIHHTEEVDLALATVDGMMMMMMITLMLVVTTHLSLTPTMVNHRQETKEEEAEVTLEEVVNVVEGVEGEVDAVIEEIGEVEEVEEEVMEGRMLVKEAVTMIQSQVVLSRST